MKKTKEDEELEISEDETFDMSIDTIDDVGTDSEESDINTDLDSEDKKVVDFVQVDDSLPKFVSQADILRILSSRETFSHIIVLLGILILFAFLSFTKSALADKLIISLGYGFSFGYFLTANLSRFESLDKMIRNLVFFYQEFFQ